MKILILFLILLSFSCKSTKAETESLTKNFVLGKDVTAVVSKIDTSELYFFIFIENENEFFKIISDKNQPKPNSGVKLEVGKKYTFRVQQITDRSPKGKNSQFTPINYLDIDKCITIDGITICTESAFELATTSNLKGLYLIYE